MKMRQPEISQLLKKYKRGQCTPEEKVFIDRWFEAMGHGDYPPLSAAELEDIKDKSRARLRAHASHEDNDRRARRSGGHVVTIRTVAYAVAATLLLLAIASVLLKKSDVRFPEKGAVAELTVTNESAQEKKILMADGSVISLKPGSQLTYSEGFAGPERRVSLEGEAFFEVAKDSLRPFLVDANEVVTRVLGTSFTVSAFRDASRIMVEVKTGKVSVLTKGASDHAGNEVPETILTPNQKVVYHKASQLVTRGLVDEPQPVIPKEKVRSMHFERASVSRVFDGLEEVYGVTIEFDQEVFASCILTTSIAEGSIRSRLDIICQAINAQYTFTEDKIVISGEGCGSK